jgi:hypothetical protein
MPGPWDVLGGETGMVGLCAGAGVEEDEEEEELFG